MGQKYFACKTDRSPAAYRAGEEIAFHIFFREDGEKAVSPQFKWELFGDFGLHDEGVASGETGELTVSASLPREGFVYLFVTATEADGTPLADADRFYGGAAVEPEKLTSVTEKPEDYDAFWESSRRELYAVPPVLLEKKALPEDPMHLDHYIYDIKVAAAGGTPVSGILTVPKKEGKRPSMVEYQGYGVKSAWTSFADDMNVLCINAHGIHNREEEDYYRALAEGRLRGYGFDKEQNQSPYTCYFKYMMLRAGQAMRFMMTMPEWDGKNLTAWGGSQGAVQSMHAAFLVPEVSRLDIFVPWLCDIRAAKADRYCRWEEKFDVPALPYFDLTLRAPAIRVHADVMAGLGDLTSPPSGVCAMVHRLGGEKTFTLVQSRAHIYCSPEAENFAALE